MVDPSVVTAVRNYLRTLQGHGIVVSFGVVFGSWATEKADEWSDIDLLVVSPNFDGPRNRQDVDLLWRLAARCDSRIEPIPCGERQWEEDDSSAIVEIARREGKPVSLSEETEVAHA
ncbi:MAG: nucleotidyltransferase domain-containing protein [Candidatus Tectomicrobia bacterium]|uniref:Nucleotidyltransferase domain-containing protein n=1 Tax=Tectimicrobiota bacterium TaxID=2528274 RepID=A0A932CP70_UNCTE|nr:nucleotidyltransferase domain-containing protein [Candidatus Tectomicrobia bacterium]